MISPHDVLIHGLTASAGFITAFTHDLSPTELLHRPSDKANCAAWLMGHLTLTDRGAAMKRLGATNLPPLPEGFEKRFSRDEGCPQAADFGDTSILLPLFQQTREVLIDAVRSASLADLEKPIEPPHPRFKTIAEMANFMAIHTSLHAGQLSSIRRSLGRPPLI